MTALQPYRSRIARYSLCGLLVLATCGCAYSPTIQHPKSEPIKPEGTAYDCTQIDAALLKTDTVRWVIRDDGGTLETSGHRTARYVGNFFLVPLSIYALYPVYANDAGSAVLDAADHRILELLRLKRANSCPAGITSEPGMTDLQMLEALEPLMPDDGTPDRPVLDRRTELLDHLRAPLPAAPVTNSPGP
jgi:hypothetical protein